MQQEIRATFEGPPALSTANGALLHSRQHPNLNFRSFRFEHRITLNSGECLNDNLLHAYVFTLNSSTLLNLRMYISTMISHPWPHSSDVRVTTSESLACQTHAKSRARRTSGMVQARRAARFWQPESKTRGHNQHLDELGIAALQPHVISQLRSTTRCG